MSGDWGERRLPASRPVDNVDSRWINARGSEWDLIGPM